MILRKINNTDEIQEFSNAVDFRNNLWKSYIILMLIFNKTNQHNKKTTYAKCKNYLLKDELLNAGSIRWTK